MADKHLSITEAKQQLGEIVKRIAYGGERYVIEVRGKPKAVISSCEASRERRVYTLEEAKQRTLARDALREKIKSESGVLSDSVEIIRQMREERDEQLFGSR